MKRHAWRNLLVAAAALTAAISAGACAGGAPAGTQSGGTKAEAPSQSQSQAETGTGGDLVDGYQLIRDYGLCGPGNKTVYQMPYSGRPTVEEDGVRATLSAVVYLDGEWRFQVAL